MNNQLNWNQENNLREQITALTGEIDGSLAGMPVETNSNSNDKGKKEKGNKVANPEELILRPGEGSLAFADSLDLPYDIQNTAEELYRDIRQNGTHLEVYGKNYWVEEFSYDPAGNVTQKANGWGAIEYQYNSANQLVKAGERTYQYDLNGNLVQEELGKYQASYQYNYENRLISAINNSHPHFMGGSKKPFKGEVTYVYDPLGRKANKTVVPMNGKKVDVSSYMYDGRGVNVLAEYQLEVHSNGNPGKNKGNPGNPGNPFNKGKLNFYNEYYYGHSLIAINYLKHPDRGRVHSNVSFYHQDTLGSVSMITGKNGQVIDRYEYDAYGSPYNGRFEQGNNLNPYGFTGQRYEVELGVYAFAYRTYNPRSMRWLTPDPIRDGTNWYAYVNGDPVNLWDPLGLENYIRDPLTGSNYSKEWAYIDSVERTTSDGETPSLSDLWNVIVDTNESYSDFSTAFDQSQGTEYLTALSTSGLPYIKETAAAVLGTKEILDAVSNIITTIDTGLEYYYEISNINESSKDECD